MAGVFSNPSNLPRKHVELGQIRQHESDLAFEALVVQVTELELGLLELGRKGLQHLWRRTETS